MQTYECGHYRARILEQGFSATARGTAFFFLEVEITGRCVESGGAQPCPRNRRQIRYYISNQIGIDILLADLRAIGEVVGEITRLSSESPDYLNLCDRTIDVTCYEETYQGRQQQRWRITRHVQRLSLEEVQKLATQVIVTAKPMVAPTGSEPPPAPPQTAE